jgi:tetratricopeptide (TPR) repeat protein
MAETAVQSGNAYQTDEALDHALVMRLKALKINRLLGSQDGMADDYQRLGILYALRGQLARSVRLLQKAMLLEDELNRLQPMADCCFNLAAVHDALHDRETACRYFKEALFLDEQSGNQKGLIQGHLALSQEHLQSERHHDAIPHLNKALALQAGSTLHHIDIGDALVRIARILLRSAHATIALETLKGAQDIYERCDHLCGMAEVTALMGVGHHLCGHRRRAEDLLREGITLNRALGRKTRLADCHANLANLCWASGRRTEAEQLYRGALALFIETHRSSEAQRVQQLLKELSQ